MKKTTLTIAIPAYNEGRHIARLVLSLFKQRQKTYELTNIIVASDGSSDNTVSSLEKIKNKNLTIIDSKRRRGKAYRQNQMFARTGSDIIVLLDADIVVTQPNFIELLIKPIISGEGDMTSSAILEQFPRTLFEEVLDISMRLKRILFAHLSNGNNLYNCHGPARAMSRNIYKKIVFPQSSGEDMYSYLAVLNLGGRFVYVAKAEVHYRLPASPTDHYKQSIRYLSAIDAMTNYFPKDLVKKELLIPKITFIKAGVAALPMVFRYPFHTILYVGVCLCTIIGNKLQVRPKELWSIKSSKIFSHAK